MSETRRASDEIITKIAGDVGYIRGRVDDLVEAKKDHETRISVIEDRASAYSGEKKATNKNERFITALISVIFSAAVTLAAAWIDRQPTGGNNVNTSFIADTGDSTRRPAGSGEPLR